MTKEEFEALLAVEGRKLFLWDNAKAKRYAFDVVYSDSTKHGGAGSTGMYVAPVVVGEWRDSKFAALQETITACYPYATLTI